MVGFSAVLAAAGLTLAGVGSLMWGRRIPPNRWVGLRTPRTLADRDVWYGANAIAGRDLAVAGSLTAVLALLLAAALPPEVPTEAVALGAWLLPAAPLLLAVVHTFWAVSAWLADRDGAISGRHGVERSAEVGGARARRDRRAGPAVRVPDARTHGRAARRERGGASGT